MRWFKDARTTYNLAVGNILRDGSHKLKPEDVNLAQLEGTLVKTYVSKEGVLGLKNRHHADTEGYQTTSGEVGNQHDETSSYHVEEERPIEEDVPTKQKIPESDQVSSEVQIQEACRS